MRLASALLLAAVAILAAGCGAVTDRQRAATPRSARRSSRASAARCHTLADAGTTGTIGPNLDDAFAYDKKQGFDEPTIRDVVRGQIAYAEADPGTGTRLVPNPGMPPNLITGQDARDVAVYVAKCAAVPHCGVTAAGGG